mmetsp:Transcript_56471/g.133053  ORF Transcript_56471/g.133053 Transcript_56471/m.133053 type:complete len:324 (-) Transcript_56471:22-993(-)
MRLCTTTWTPCASRCIAWDSQDRPPTIEALQSVKEQVEKHGMRLGVVEGGPPMDKIVAGAPGREEQLENYKQCLRNMGTVGIPVLCYNFMHWGCRVGRTSYEVPIRGGALSSAFKWEDWDNSLTEFGETSEQQTWENLEWFLKQIIPVAEEAGVCMALHPDDPPVPRLRGLARIMGSIDNLEKLINLYPSRHNGITFCQGTISSMGVNIPEVIPRFKDRVHFVHFRDVVGNAVSGFTEVFQDEGQTDMLAALKAWQSIGFSGPIRPDHVPLLEGEEGHATGAKAQGYFSGKASGYTMMGRLFAVGYMRGLFEAVFGKSPVAKP